MTMEQIEALIPPGILAEMRQRQSGKVFFDQVARDLANLKDIPKVNGNDFLLALLAANLGIAHDPVVSAKPVAIGEQFFEEDIIPFLPNSRLVFYVQVSGVASIIQLTTKFGDNVIVNGSVLDGTPFALSVPREFNVPVTRRRKYNLLALTATTVDIAFAIEFRIGL